MLNILSLGAGVQSSTLALMAACGEITPMPDCAIFADTGAEPEGVYKWLDWLETQLPFPVLRRSAGSLTEQSLKIRVSKRTGQTYVRSMIPAYVAKYTGGRSLLGRKCTADHKVKVIVQTARKFAQIPRGCKEVRVIQWIGISTDEAHRMKPSSEKWIVHRWPLIDMDMSRQSCLNWMLAHGYPEPPRSACIYCPFHSDAEWIRLKDKEPQEFAKVVQFERDMQAAHAQQTGTARLNGIAYLHNDLKPIDQVEFKTTPERAQLDLFGNECEGLCGV